MSTNSKLKLRFLISNSKGNESHFIQKHGDAVRLKCVRNLNWNHCHIVVQLCSWKVYHYSFHRGPHGHFIIGINTDIVVVANVVIKCLFARFVFYLSDKLLCYAVDVIDLEKINFFSPKKLQSQLNKKEGENGH